MNKAMAWICLLAVFVLASASQAQESSSCLAELVPCLQYINSKKAPSRSCCDPLKALIKSDPKCLCSMLGSSTAKQAGVNTTQAQKLPARCGEKVTASMCSLFTKGKRKVASSAPGPASAPVLVVVGLILVFQVLWVSFL